MTDTMELDAFDREIIEAVSDTALGRKQIRRETDTGLSIQAIGRRINQLVEEGYLEKTAVFRPDELRTMVEGFKATEKGRQALNENTGGEGD